jgi:hypothetical protein
VWKKAVCPNLIVGKSTPSPQAQDINLFATYIARAKWHQSQYVHDRFAVRPPAVCGDGLDEQ